MIIIQQSNDASVTQARTVTGTTTFNVDGDIDSNGLVMASQHLGAIDKFPETSVGTSSMQVYSRSRAPCPKILNKQQSMSVDLEYSVNICTPSKYQLVCSLSAGNGDDTRLHKEHIEFGALPAIELSDEMLFVATSVSNVTCEPQADIMPMYGLIVFDYSNHIIYHLVNQYLIMQLQEMH